MDELGEFGPLDMQLAKERDDSPDYDRESALNDEHSLKLLESRAQLLYQKMFRSVYQDKNIPINRNELSKHLFDYIAHFYQPLLGQINPYKLGEKKRKLEVGEKYAEKILLQYHQGQKAEIRRLMIDYLVNGCPDHIFTIDERLMRFFLPGVVRRTSDISAEYSNAVQILSNYFIEFDPEKTTYVGFALPIETPKGTDASTPSIPADGTSEKPSKGTKAKAKSLAPQNGQH